MNSKIKGFLYAFINIFGNLLLIGVIPMEYKTWAVLAFNIAQVVYAYYDPTYVFEKLGSKFGRAYTKADLK